MHTVESLTIARNALLKAVEFLNCAIAEVPIAIQHNNMQAYEAAMRRAQGDITLACSVMPMQVAYDMIASELVVEQLASYREDGTPENEIPDSASVAHGLLDTLDSDDLQAVEEGVRASLRAMSHM